MLQISQEEIFAALGFASFLFLVLFAILAGFRQLNKDAERMNKEFKETGDINSKNIKLFFGLFSLDELYSSRW